MLKLTLKKDLPKDKETAWGFPGDDSWYLENNHLTPEVRKNLKSVFQKFEKKIYRQPAEVSQSASSTLIVSPKQSEAGLDAPDQLRMAAKRVYRSARERSFKNLILPVQNLSLSEFEALVEALMISSYRFDKFKSRKKRTPEPNIYFFRGPHQGKDWDKAFRKAKTVCESINLCRNLVNEPGEILNPNSFANTAIQAAKKIGLRARLRDEKQLKKEGFNGLITVGKGSSNPPRMVTLTYEPAAKKSKDHLVLLGKGVTFDTGGISLKPGQDMWEMKCDMAGAATTLSTLVAIARLKLPVKVSAILVLAENRPGLAAVLPGDIFKAKNGKTVMVENTDAEGRLVLSDGLWEAGAIGATHIVDLATLTGAIIRALGSSMAGLFCNDGDFCSQLIQSGKNVSEKLWEMPLEEEYRKQLDDTVADFKNIGKAEAGAITAALFLKEFVPAKAKWAHLDIAGTAFITSPWKYFDPGATGWGVKSLVEYAQTRG